MALKVHFFMYGFVIVMLSFSVTQAIRCYVCGKDLSSNTTKMCDKGSPVGNLSPVECPSKIKADACGYSVQEEPYGQEVIRRTCVSSKINSDKMSIQGDPLELDRCYNNITVAVRGITSLTYYKIFCTCTTDECNSSGGQSISRISHDVLTSRVSLIIILGFIVNVLARNMM